MEAIKCKVQSLWQAVHHASRRVPRATWDTHPAALRVSRDGDSVVLSVAVESATESLDLADIRLDANAKVALIAALTSE